MNTNILKKLKKQGIVICMVGAMAVLAVGCGTNNKSKTSNTSVTTEAQTPTAHTSEKGKVTDNAVSDGAKATEKAADAVKTEKKSETESSAVKQEKVSESTTEKIADSQNKDEKAADKTEKTAADSKTNEKTEVKDTETKQENKKTDKK